MTWYSFGLICVLALGVLPMTGCSDAGAPGREFPCTEQGIRGAIAEGGGPYTFDCDGPTTVAVEGAFEVENDVILDGESGLTLDGATFIVRDEKVKLDLLGFTIINGEVISYGRLFMRDCTVSDGGSGTGAGIVNVAGTTTLTDCTIARNLGGIWNSGTLTATNCTVSQNVGVFDQSYGGIFNNATLTLTNSTVSGNFGFGGLPNDIVNIGTLAIANTLVDGECFADRETVTSNGHNIESPGNTCGFDQTGDQSGVSADDLKLGELSRQRRTDHDPRAGAFAHSKRRHRRNPGSRMPRCRWRCANNRPAGRATACGDLGSEPKCDVGAFERQTDDP